MTSNTTFREKGRAVFLAALMVLSVVAMSATFAGAAAAFNSDTYDEGPTITSSENLDDVWVGQEITLVDDDWDGDFVSIAEGPETTGEDPDTVTTVGFDDDEVTFNTEELVEGEIYHIYAHGDTTETFEFEDDAFEATSENLDVSFESDTVAEDGTLDLEVSSDRPEQSLNISSDDFDADELDDIFNSEDVDVYDHGDEDVITLKTVEDDDEIPANFLDVESGEYEFEFDVTDSIDSDNATIEVRDSDADREFVNGPYTQQQGDEFNITVDHDDTNDAFVTIGDYEDAGYEVGLFVEDTEGDHDEINITFNAHEAGQGDEYDAISAQQEDVNLEIAYMQVVDSDTIHINDDYFDESDLDSEYDTVEDDITDSSATPTATLDNPLAATDYELNVGDGYEVDDGAVEFTDRSDSSFINLEPVGAPGDVTTHTAPEDDSMSDLDDFEDATVTATDSFAEDDYLLLTVEDAGLTGAFPSDDDVSVGANTDDDEGLSALDIELEIEQTDVASNLGDEVWNTSDEADNDLEVSLVNGGDYDGELLIFNIDTEFDEGDYEWTLLFDEGDYIDEDEEVEIEGEFAVEERDVTLNAVDEVPNVDGAELSGDTNVAPGTEIDMVSSATGEFVLTDDPVVADDYSFTGAFDFSDYEPGIEFDVEAEEPEGASDDFTAELVDGDGPVINVDTDAPDEVKVGDDATLDVTISNNGGATAEDVEIGVVIDGENVDEDTESLDADESWTSSYDIPTDVAGDVEWSVTADDAEDDGVTTVSEKDDTDDDKSDDDKSDDDGADDDGAADDGAAADDGTDDGETDDDGSPGFGVAVALAALLGAAMLALRKQN
ncbi:uncharacterized protein Nmag_1630 [Natrialba magadii ATCC 43099]|uniref:Uncharacterized protein n=1 Tax=Natrialba magadii (strain ATCC 43099 / DSM 3394 / CCM 3739 / CIP 104546 / IAM 13178 / JCM 8861 / NBRC 102185 / NCIMB 2190 / MS3) TaxID=547559 RepID=D3SUE8_NATMM|nr:BGTF surface domain-containing protein [Natrialba magadii]ADD05206.1 uncharacterized protein Nmag_1630 [Natrialba magadii ATCC 43099]ELY23242.1 hypothetical protein C500_20671 [Natrialba magadii ATCC 43099]